MYRVSALPNHVLIALTLGTTQRIKSKNPPHNPKNYLKNLKYTRQITDDRLLYSSWHGLKDLLKVNEEFVRHGQDPLLQIQVFLKI